MRKDLVKGSPDMEKKKKKSNLHYWWGMEKNVIMIGRRGASLALTLEQSQTRSSSKKEGKDGAGTQNS